MEHLCELHGQQPPVWLEKPERFLKITWILPTTPTMVKEAIAFAPAAFIRHGALPDPRCLDARGVSDMSGSLGQRDDRDDPRRCGQTCSWTTFGPERES